MYAAPSIKFLLHLEWAYWESCGPFWNYNILQCIQRRKAVNPSELIDVPVCFFFFEIFEETFAAGVIKRISLFREGLDNIQFIKQFSKCKGYVLWSSIRVKHQSSRTISGMICFLKGLDYQICIGSGWYIPRDNFSRKRSIMIQR